MPPEGSKREKVKKLILSCFEISPLGENECRSYTGRNGNRGNNWIWQHKRGAHLLGEFSMAVLTGNKHNEDRSELKTGALTDDPNGPLGIFVGIYDGHGGSEASVYVLQNLFRHLKKFATDLQAMNTEAIQQAYEATEEDFRSFIRQNWKLEGSKYAKLASVGTCCLVGVVTNGKLFIANAGDSRAVLGRGDRGSTVTEAIQLSTEHNASFESVREELLSKHPNDPNVVYPVRNVWRVKGIIQISRSIGDFYLKSMEFNQSPLASKFRISHPFDEPFLSAEPSICELRLDPKDKFVIFASDGLWDHLTNQEAVDIVNMSSRNGAAKKLIKKAVEVTACKKEVRYRDVKNLKKSQKRYFHDDISVVIIFLDEMMVTSASNRGPQSGGMVSSRSTHCLTRGHRRTHSLP